MATQDTDLAPSKATAAPAPKPQPKPAPAPALISLDDYVSRETRLTNRPEMRGAFIRACQRDRLMRGTHEAFARKLAAFEKGAV